MVVFDAYLKTHVTRLAWQVKSRRYMECDLELSPGSDMTVSRSGSTVTISCPDKETAEEAITVTPRDSSLKLLDDTHPMSIKMYAKSERAARELARAVNYLRNRSGR